MCGCSLPDLGDPCSQRKQAAPSHAVSAPPRPPRPRDHSSAQPRCGASLPGPRIATARPRAKSGSSSSQPLGNFRDLGLGLGPFSTTLSYWLMDVRFYYFKDQKGRIFCLLGDRRERGVERRSRDKDGQREETLVKGPTKSRPVRETQPETRDPDSLTRTSDSDRRRPDTGRVSLGQGSIR